MDSAPTAGPQLGRSSPQTSVEPSHSEVKVAAAKLVEAWPETKDSMP